MAGGSGGEELERGLLLLALGEGAAGLGGFEVSLGGWVVLGAALGLAALEARAGSALSAPGHSYRSWKR